MPVQVPETNCHTVQQLAEQRVLGALLESLRQGWGSFDLLLHHQQGEFHHDVFVRVPDGKPRLPGEYLVVSTNCNGGVKEVLCFDDLPDPAALWHFRCPENAEFEGVLPKLLAVARTEHWFDPCELLGADARSELKEEFRARSTEMAGARRRMLSLIVSRWRTKDGARPLQGGSPRRNPP